MILAITVGVDGGQQLATTWVGNDVGDGDDGSNNTGAPGGGRGGGGGSSGSGDGGGCILQGLFAFYCEDIIFVWYFYV
jgi:hypothetical protein